MLRLIQVRALIQPFHAARDMRRFVNGVAENGIGGYDPARGDQHQDYGDQDAATGEQCGDPRFLKGSLHPTRAAFASRIAFSISFSP